MVLLVFATSCVFSDKEDSCELHPFSKLCMFCLVPFIIIASFLSCMAAK